MTMSSRREFLVGLTPGILGMAALTGVTQAGETSGRPGAVGPGTDKYRAASDRAVAWLLSRLQDDGGFGPDAVDMTCYHKAAYLFSMAGETAAANRMLTLIKHRYLQPDGDFMISPTQKVNKVNYNELTWGYSNGWFALAAHRAGRFDISYPAYRYLLKLRHPQTGGFTSSRPGDPAHPVVELLATAHVGMLALHLGDLDVAGSAADLVRRFESEQKDKSRGMYLRMDAHGRFITRYPDTEAAFYFLDVNVPKQFYFVPGYAAAFLCQMYLVTAEKECLSSAQNYVDFSAGISGVYGTHFSHKLAWGASLLYRITGESRYRELAMRVADMMVGLQGDDGAWFGSEPPFVSLDQSAECAIWLRTIPAELAARA